MNKIPIVVYTHTDVSELWPMFFGEFKKYMSDTKIYVAINKEDDRLSEYTQLYYDDTKPYTERLKDILNQLKDEIIIFLHEDMILIGNPMIDNLTKYIGYVADDKVKSIKLISVNGNFTSLDIDTTVVSNEDTKFSIQPTIIKTKTFLDLLSKVEPLNIWEFEDKVPVEEGHYMVSLGNEKRRGIYHNDSLVFPYIATAINKGKWNYSEYEKELNELFNIYNINPFERGIS
jgi:sugar-specific transcriptional regulator TrmB